MKTTPCFTFYCTEHTKHCNLGTLKKHNLFVLEKGQTKLSTNHFRVRQKGKFQKKKKTKPPKQETTQETHTAEALGYSALKQSHV